MINHVSDMYNLRGQTVDKFGLDHTGCIKYRFNQQGFRSNLNFDATPKHALFGCSLIFGIGVNNSDTVASLLPNTYNFGLAGRYNNNDIYQTIVNYVNSDLYSLDTKMCVVWTNRDQQSLPYTVANLAHLNLYHFFCGNIVPGIKCFKFIDQIDYDISRTHMGPKTHAVFAKILWALFNQ